MSIGISKFVLRQTKRNFGATRFTKRQLKEIITTCEYFGKWKEGYAPFCEIITIPNNWDIKFPLQRITKQNEKNLRSKYSSRRKEELPYLNRFFITKRKDNAKSIKVIVYDKNQMIKEGDKVGAEDWYVVSVNAENGFEVPMSPDTIIRNHLGIKFGGSGKEIDEKEYRKSVKFWEKWAFVK